MNFLSLHYFLVVAEEKSFSRAAAKLFVSQQSLSEHIGKLENEFGVPLFNRTKPLTLTVAGECLVQGSKEILGAQDRLISDMAQATHKRRSRITIAVATFGEPPFLADLIASYTRLYPEYEAVVVKRMVTDIVDNMAGVDLYFSYLPLSGGLENVILSEDCMAVTASPALFRTAGGEHLEEVRSNLAENRSLSLLRDLPYLLLFDRNNVISQDLVAVFKDYSITPRIGFRSESLSLNIEMCIRGLGALLMPYGFCRRNQLLKSHMDDGSLESYRINTPGLDCSLALSYERRKHLNPAEISFIELAKDFIASDPV